jgi:hypothetical protein
MTCHARATVSRRRTCAGAPRALEIHEVGQASASATRASVVLRRKALGLDERIEVCAHAPHRRAHGGLRERPSTPFQPCQKPSLRLPAPRIASEHLLVNLLPQRVVKRHQGRAPRRQRERCDAHFSLCGLALIGLETLPVPVLDDGKFPRMRGDSLPRTPICVRCAYTCATAPM